MNCMKIMQTTPACFVPRKSQGAITTSLICNEDLIAWKWRGLPSPTIYNTRFTNWQLLRTSNRRNIISKVTFSFLTSAMPKPLAKTLLASSCFINQYVSSFVISLSPLTNNMQSDKFLQIVYHITIVLRQTWKNEKMIHRSDT